jgi:acyl-CoA thioesterase
MDLAPSPAVATGFAQATTLHADPHVAGRFHLDYAHEWTSLRGMHGGFQAAVAVRAAEAAEPELAVRTVAVSFLRAGAVGPAVVDVDVVRRSRTFATALITISQGGQPVVTARTTAVTATTGHEWTTPVTDRPAPFSTAVTFTPPLHLPNFGQVRLRLDPDTVPSESGGGEPRIAGYLRPLDGGQLDAAWLVAAGDWFPPSAFRRVAPPVGGISVDYTVHLHRTATLADDEWLAAVFTTANSVGGLALEHGTLATADGVVVAETFHTRWTG